MLFVPLAAAAAATFAIAAAPQAPAQQEARVDVDARAAVSTKCPRGANSIKEYRRYASRVYRRTKVSKKAHKRMAYMRRCQHSRAAVKIVARFHRRYVRERRARQAARRAARLASSVTPYGPWAIPANIVMCESGGSWNAVNRSSGARGPYQFLGWPVPWPVNSQSDKLAHHRMAARLWAGGRGRGHWAACL